MQKDKESPNERKAENERRPLRERRWVQFVGAVTSLLVVVAVLTLIGRRFGTDDLPQFVTGNLINVLIFTAIVGQVLIYRNQRDIMQQQRQAMYGQLEIMSQSLTHDFEVSKIQFEDMQIQWKSMGQQIDAMNNQTGAMINQTTLMNLSLEETRKMVDQNERAVKAAENNVETVEKTAIYTNRAYIVAKIRGAGREWPQLRLRIQNTGNTPANDVTVTYDCGLREEPPHTEWPDGGVTYDAGWIVIERLGLIAPQSSYHVIETQLVVALDNAQTDQWRSGKLKFYCWGRIYYEDIFNDKRHTDFCFVMSEEHPNGYPCKHGNQAI